MAVETTLILFKPDAIEKKLVGTVLSRFDAAGFRTRGLKMMQLTPDLLAEHYSHIADKPFFPEIVTFMSKTPVVALALEGDDVITKVRDLLGPTDSRKAEKGTIRGDFALETAQNIVHASDGPEAEAAELALWFDPAELLEYERDVDRWVLAPED